MFKNSSGIFITFEGIEGSGKTTQAKMLSEFILKKTKKNVLLTREPGGTENAETIRNVLTQGEVNRWLPVSELLLFFSARYDLFYKKINPFISNGGIVICDRFIDSTFAYQGAKKINYSIINSLVEILKITPNNEKKVISVMPNITFLIDIKTELSRERIIKRSKKTDRFESLKNEFHDQVRNEYLKIASKEERIKVINGDQSPNKIHDEIVKMFLNNFNCLM